MITYGITNKYIHRIEVLDRVKKLFLIPEMEVATTKMVAEYFEVDAHTLEMCYQRSKEEINLDGVVKKKPKDIDFTGNSQLVRTQNVSGGKVLQFTGGEVKIPFAGIRIFPKRAILRIAMLLRDSKVAKEIRTQLLNTFEHATLVMTFFLSFSIYCRCFPKFS